MDPRCFGFMPHPSDIVVATAGKAGTTWMQQLVTQLLGGGSEDALESFGSLHELSPWVEFRTSAGVLAALSPNSARLWLAERIGAGVPASTAAEELEVNDEAARILEATVAGYAALKRRIAASHGGRRVFKSHAPASLPVVARCPQIFVARAGLDAVLSLFHHWRATKPDYRAAAAAAAGAPPAPLDAPGAFLDMWLDDFEGWGAPAGGVAGWAETVRSFWELRGHENVLLVHFSDLKRDPRQQAARVAAHCGAGAECLDAALDHSSFAYMKAHQAWFDLDTLVPGHFLRKGDVGAGAGAFSDEQVARFDAAAARELGDDCAAWLRDGGEVPGAGGAA